MILEILILYVMYIYYFVYKEISMKNISIRISEDDKVALEKRLMN